ncbi:MAG: hypothetical protein RRY33_07285 [Alistipes sp.]
MKNKIRGSVVLVWTILSTILFFAASCQESASDDQTPTSGSVDVQVRISNSGSYTSRSLTAAEECDIHEIYVLAFKGDVLSYLRAAKEVNNAAKTFTAPLKASNSSSDTYHLVVLANVGQAIDALQAKLAAHETVTAAEVQTLVCTTITGKLYATAPKQIALWGDIAGEQVISGSTAKLTVSLLRSVARVDVGLGQRTLSNGTYSWDGLKGGAAIPFALQSIHLYRPNNQYTVIPLAANYDAAQGKVTAPSAVGTPFTAAESETNFAYTDITSSLYSTCDIYCPEADIRITADGKSGDLNHLNRMALIVGGSFSANATSYYRLDFTVGNGTSKTLTNVLRNHLYQFNITAVQGNGAATPAEAYASTSVNMEATVLDWTSEAEDVIFDGEHFFYIQSKRITLQGNKNLSGHIGIGSDLAPSLWEMSLDGATFTTAASVSNADFTVTKPTLSEGGFLTVTTRNVAAAKLTAQLTLRVGRLQCQVSLVQDPDAPEAWYLGGDYQTNL